MTYHDQPVPDVRPDPIGVIIYQGIVPRLRTDSYPVRYVAWDNPKVWVEVAHPEYSGGYEWAVYTEVMINRFSDYTQDGIYIEIVSYQGKDFLLDCHASRPDRTRAQRRFSGRYPTYNQAKSAAFDWLPTGEAFCAAAWPHEPPDLPTQEGGVPSAPSSTQT